LAPRFPLGRVVVRGRSMEPTLRDGDHLLVRWGGNGPRTPGGLVVVQWPDSPLSVKRLVLRDAQGWWVQRDNPGEGVDSWGSGPVSELRGRVLLRLWPLRRAGRVP
jgi:phage repressor protein C with HTH and peptisase S24 domain